MIDWSSLIVLGFLILFMTSGTICKHIENRRYQRLLKEREEKEAREAVAKRQRAEAHLRAIARSRSLRTA